MNSTSIEWTDRTVNPFRARDRETGKVGWQCVKPSPGCAHCYSETLNGRFGTGLPYTARSLERVELFLDEKMLAAILRLKTPQKVFPCDMTDLFLDAVPTEDIAAFFAVMAVAHWHTFQVLTKRADRMRWLLSDPGFARSVGAAIDERVRPLIDGKIRGDWGHVSPLAHELRRGEGWPLANVWAGVSVEDQKRADERIPHLLATPAAVRFLSAEPLLGPIDLGRWTEYGLECSDCDWAGQEDDSPGEKHFEDTHPEDREFECPSCGKPCAHTPIDELLGNGLRWVICGGESGHGARPCDVAWIRSIVRQCGNAGVPAFVKQLGACAFGRWDESSPVDDIEAYGRRVFRDRKGGDPSEWPEDLRGIREFPRVAEPAPC